MACPFTPSPHGLCFSPSWVWSYTDSNSQVPTISSLSDFCCWAKVGKAKLIANPTRTNSEDSHFFLIGVKMVGRCRPCFGISQAPGTSVSRGVRRNALAQGSERLPKKRPTLLGVNGRVSRHGRGELQSLTTATTAAARIRTDALWRAGRVAGLSAGAPGGSGAAVFVAFIGEFE